MEIYNNQEQFFNANGIFDIDNDLRLFIDENVENKISMSLNAIKKRLGPEAIYDGPIIKFDIVKRVYEIIKKHDPELKLELNKESENLRDYIEYILIKFN